MQNNPIVSREEWLAARRALLVREKEATRQRDRSVVHVNPSSDMLGGSKRRDIDFRLWRGP